MIPIKYFYKVYDIVGLIQIYKYPANKLSDHIIQVTSSIHDDAVTQQASRRQRRAPHSHESREAAGASHSQLRTMR
jgi:hypothetical protein